MRALKSTIAVLVALGLLVGALWLGDQWVRSEVERRVETAVTEQLPELEATVDAELGGGFAIPQLISGTLEEITITSPEAVIDGVAITDVVILAEGVAIRGDGSIASLHATGTAPTESVITAVERRVDLPEGVTLELRDGTIAAVASVLGVPLEAEVALVAQPRAIEVTVERFLLGDAVVDVEDIPFDLSALIGTAVVDLDTLPEGVELTEVTVTPDGVDLVLDGTDVVG